MGADCGACRRRAGLPNQRAAAGNAGMPSVPAHKKNKPQNPPAAQQRSSAAAQQRSSAAAQERRSAGAQQRSSAAAQQLLPTDAGHAEGQAFRVMRQFPDAQKI